MRIDIRGANKGVGQLARFVMANKIFLVHARGQLNDLLRHIQKRRIEAAKHRHRPFRQARIFDDQAFIFHQIQTSSVRRRLCAVTDDAAAFGKMHEDMGRAQLLNIIAGISDDDRAAMVKTMAHRLRTADDAVNFAMHDRVAKQSHDTLQWAHPTQALG